jgi:CrcB protein
VDGAPAEGGARVTAELMAELAVFFALVAVGSAAGGMARFLISGIVARAVGETFPWGTMVVNVTGAFSIGVLGGLLQGGNLDNLPDLWPVAVTGFLGSYTTVSSFSLQTLALVRDGEWRRAAGNVVLSLALCLAAVAGGGLVAHAALGAGAP